MLTQERLKQLLDYDPLVGVFTWKVKRRGQNVVGAVAGAVRPDGYRVTKIDGRMYLLHRLAWFYCYGEWPHHVDHFDGVRLNNRIANLRDVTPKQNHENQALRATNSTGFRGVTQDKRTGRFVARITHNLKMRHVGSFGSAEDAAIAAKAARDESFTHHHTPYSA